MSKILWFIQYGQDISHMWESKHFNRKKDAINFIKSLPPIILQRKSFKLMKYEYIKSKIYGDIVNIKETTNHNFEL